MRHVFVETNWVVGYAAPPPDQMPVALELFTKAQRGDIQLHLPAICLAEARATIRRKFQGREAAKRVRGYLTWAVRAGEISGIKAQTGFQLLSQFENYLLNDLPKLDARLEWLRTQPAVDVFALNESMLGRSVLLSTQGLNLKPFDQSILAAVLVRADELWSRGEKDLLFCELDKDLHHWVGTQKNLEQLYDAAHLSVTNSFDI